MTILHQVGLCLVTLALMATCAIAPFPAGIWVVAMVGGWCVAQYDEGMQRDG